MKQGIVVCACALAASLAVPAAAHHSFAMFDASKILTLKGTVKEFQWTNPHSWVQLVVVTPKGEMQEWSLELGSPADLAQHGWRPKTVLPGDKVSIAIHPLKDGTKGGQLLSVVLPTGKKIGGETNAAAAAAAARAP